MFRKNTCTVPTEVKKYSHYPKTKTLGIQSPSENGSMEPKYLAEEVIVPPNHDLRFGDWTPRKKNTIDRCKFVFPHEPTKTHRIGFMFFYLHKNHKKSTIHVGNYTCSSHGSDDPHSANEQPMSNFSWGIRCESPSEI